MRKSRPASEWYETAVISSTRRSCTFRCLVVHAGVHRIKALSLYNLPLSLVYGVVSLVKTGACIFGRIQGLAQLPGGTGIGHNHAKGRQHARSHHRRKQRTRHSTVVPCQRSAAASVEAPTWFIPPEMATSVGDLALTSNSSLVHTQREPYMHKASWGQLRLQSSAERRRALPNTLCM